MVCCLSFVCLMQLRDKSKLKILDDLSSISSGLNSTNAQLKLIEAEILENENIDCVERKAKINVNFPEAIALKDYNSLVRYCNEMGIDLDKFPKLPDGLVPEDIIDKKLVELTNCPLLNPGMKELNRLVEAQILREVTRWNGFMKILESELLLEFVKAREKLFSQKEFIDYHEGDVRKNLDGVVTLGEPIEGGVRVYYFFPEEFSRIYEIKRMKILVARTFAAMLIKMIENAS